MPNKRDLQLGEYNIGKYAYRELHNFCLQYPEKKKRLAELRSPYRSPQITGMPSGSGRGDATERNAEMAAILSADCEMIEQTAREAGGDLYPYLLRNVTTEHMPWEILAPPCGRRQFYQARHRFFYLLHLKKKG